MSNTTRYGGTWATTSLHKIELACIAHGGQWTSPSGRLIGQGLAEHIKNFQRITWTDKNWHKWNENLIIPELAKTGRLAIFGPSSTGKSYECSATALTLYYARPRGTTIICSTTTIDSLNYRIFGEIKRLHAQARRKLPWLPGEILDSDQMIVTDPKGAEGGRNFKDGILGVPCKKGNEWQSLSEYVGIKNDVVIVIADECHLMQSGFWDGMANLLSNRGARIWALGNLNDLHSPLGKAAEPKLGWDSIPDTDKSRVYETRWFEGRAIQLIGMDSPNLDHPEGQEPYPKLIGRDYIRRCEIDYGADTIYFQMFASGKIPRSSMSKTVFTRSLAIKNNVPEEIMWGSEPITKLYALDAAYSSIGGDRTVGAPWAFGVDIEGVNRIAMLEPPKIYIGSQDPKLSHEDAIAMQCREQCEAHGIPPEKLFYDGTGRSSLTSSLAKLWSPQIIPIEFGGNASGRPNFLGFKYAEDYKDHKKGDLKPCSEVFGKFVSELWFASAAAIQANQLRQVPMDMIEEGCRRLWSDTDYGFRGKLTVEPKRGTKEKPGMIDRVGRSPDAWDMLVCAIEGARRLGFALGKLGISQEERKKDPVSGWVLKEQENLRQRLNKYQLSNN